MSEQSKQVTGQITEQVHKLVRLRLRGTLPGKRPEMRHMTELMLEDADTGRLIPFTDIEFVVVDGLVACKVTVFLADLDITTEARILTKCAYCKRTGEEGELR